MRSGDVIVTTYGALAVGQKYRIPGEKYWYHRSKNGRLTDAMRNRIVETIQDV